MNVPGTGGGMEEATGAEVGTGGGGIKEGGGGGGEGLTAGGPISLASRAAAFAAWKAADLAFARETLPGLFLGKASLSLCSLS